MPAVAQNLGERMKMQQQSERLKQVETSVRSTCGGAQFTISFDFKNAPFAEMDQHSAYGYCEQTASAIRRVCGNPLGTAAIKEKLKAVVCGFGDEPAFKFDPNGTLSYTIKFGEADRSDQIYDLLLKSL